MKHKAVCFVAALMLVQKPLSKLMKLIKFKMKNIKTVEKYHIISVNCNSAQHFTPFIVIIAVVDVVVSMPA